MNKKDLSERDICTKYITPAITGSGWDVIKQIREEVFLTDGRILVRKDGCVRGRRKRADYVLYHKSNIPIAVIEAKDNNYQVGSGMQQALEYAEMLGVPFSYSSNGDAFLEHDGSITSGSPEREIALESFPSPAELWQRYCAAKGIAPEMERVVTEDYYVDANFKAPRYYQIHAINAVVEAITKGQKRILLVMATGTGKTYVAFQTIWRLWKAGAKKRILFLADRNILVSQTMTNDFKPFGSAMTRVKNRMVDKSYEVYLALYQSISGEQVDKDIYKQFSPDFFDLIVVDECHRGSAAEDSAWREVLEYFSSATQIGLTATPKETRDVSSREYFGEPVYTYSLKRGIADGFLAPYKVVEIDLTTDTEPFRPEEGQVDKRGNVIEQRDYGRRDIDKTIVFEGRTELVAKKITEFLRGTDRLSKTIVFCEDIDHAERMRQALVNENADMCAIDRRYVMRITGDEGVGKLELDNFISPESTYPVIVTTSRLLNTGVDAQTCKVIAIDRSINSMTEFKQIIGRGTRIKEDFNKRFFTILDFKGATELFSDPQFDGDPVQVYRAKRNSSPVPPEDDIPDEPEEDDDTDNERPKKYIISGVAVQVEKQIERFFSKDGKLLGESVRGYVREIILSRFGSETSFLSHWDAASRKDAVVTELQELGIPIAALEAEVSLDLDVFDLVRVVAYDRHPITRQERAEHARNSDVVLSAPAAQQMLLKALLQKYEEFGVTNLEDMSILKLPPFSDLGTPMEIIAIFGGREQFFDALGLLKEALYNPR